MKITIIGGGNVGTQFAVHCAEKGHDTKIYTSKAYLFNEQLTIINENSITIHKGKVTATDNLEYACKDTDIYFVTIPSFCMEKFANEIYAYVKKGAYIGLIPGTGGGEHAFDRYISNKECIIFGLQRVPSVARLVECGKCVKASGYRSELHLSAIPNNKTLKCCEIVSGIFDMPCLALPNYLNVVLTPSNPILHTTRLKTIFGDYIKTRLYDKIPLFYEEWSVESSELLLKCDDEFQKICESLNKFDLSYVKSLRVHYESDTAEKLTDKLRSIESLKGIKTPCIQKGELYEPDLNSRYFKADFPYGLEIIYQIAKLTDINVPNIHDTLNWYYQVTGDTVKFSYENYGITTKSEFEKFYLK